MDDLQVEETRDVLQAEEIKDVSQKYDKQTRFMKIIIGVLTIAVIVCGIFIVNVNKQLKAQIAANDSAHLKILKSVKINSSDISDIDGKISDLEYRIGDIESILNY